MQVHSCPAQDLPAGRVIVFGRTGVGKSFLICTLFNNLRIAPYAAGRPQTVDIQTYRRPNIPAEFDDTPGFETLNIADTYEAVNTRIADRSASANVDDQYYAALLCILEPNERFEESDERIMELLDRLHLPVLVVLTKAYEDPAEANGFPDTLAARWPRVPIVRVNAKRNQGITDLVTELRQKMNAGREALVRRIAANRAFAAECEAMSNTALERVREIANSTTKWAIPVPGIELAVIHHYEEKIVQIAGEVFGFRASRDFVQRLVALWRETAIAKSEYQGVRGFIVTKLVFLVVNFATDGLVGVAAACFLRFSEKFGVDAQKILEAFGASKPARIVVCFGLILVGCLLTIRRRAYGSRVTPSYPEAVLAEFPGACLASSLDELLA
jgi:GTPase Era involved in 16S rRNA processing